MQKSSFEKISVWWMEAWVLGRREGIVCYETSTTVGATRSKKCLPCKPSNLSWRSTSDIARVAYITIIQIIDSSNSPWYYLLIHFGRRALRLSAQAAPSFQTGRHLRRGDAPRCERGRPRLHTDLARTFLSARIQRSLGTCEIFFVKKNNCASVAYSI